MEPKPTDKYHTLRVIPDGGAMLALDASTTAVGWCLADNDGYVDSGCFRPKSRDVWKRIDQIYDWVEGFVRGEFNYARKHLWLVAIEEPTGSHGNARTDRLLGAVLGVVRAVCHRFGVRFLLINPMQVKATGLDKDHTAEAALYVGKAEVDSDQADAIGLWQAAMQVLLEETAS